MNDLRIGKLIDSPQQRDAIHVAVAPVVAQEDLFAGQHIGFVVDGDLGTVSANAQTKVGIVDPFLGATKVSRGQRFWMFLYPNTITTLRHEWTHPAFAADPAKAWAEQWLAQYGAGLDLSIQELLDAGGGYVNHGEYLSHGPRFEGEYLPDEFWGHYEVMTGTKVPDRKRGSFFSCC